MVTAPDDICIVRGRPGVEREHLILEPDEHLCCGGAQEFLAAPIRQPGDAVEALGELGYLRPGDTLVLWKMDRLGRNTRGVLELVEDLTRRGVGLRSIAEELDTTGPMGKAILTVMLAFGTLERDVLIERTRAGLDAARARGRVGGRPTVVSAHKLKAAKSLIRGGASVTAAVEAVNLSRSSLYRGLARADESLPDVGSD